MSAKKLPPGKQKSKQQPTITLAQELHVDVDLRHLHEACSQVGGPELVPFMKRVKAELMRVKEGDQEGVPQVNLFVSDSISFPRVQRLFTTILGPYPFLRAIELHHCGLDDDSILCLTGFIKSYSPSPDRNPFGIQILEIPGSKITTRGAGYLGKLLGDNSTIERFVIDFTPLSDDGVKALCDHLRWNGTLKHLSMQYCGITAVGAALIASRAIKGSNIRHLSLRGNKLEGDGVTEIGRALAVGTRIEELDLADTGFGHYIDAIEVLCDGIEKCISLSSINLDLNTLTRNAPSSLLNAMTKNKHIVAMPISERVDAESYNQILDVLAQNKREMDKERKKRDRRARKGK